MKKQKALELQTSHFWLAEKPILAGRTGLQYKHTKELLLTTAFLFFTADVMGSKSVVHLLCGNTALHKSNPRRAAAQVHCLLSTKQCLRHHCGKAGSRGPGGHMAFGRSRNCTISHHTAILAQALSPEQSRFCAKHPPERAPLSKWCRCCAAAASPCLGCTTGNKRLKVQN